MPFQANCPRCGKLMLMLQSMFGKPKRCSHCDTIFRVGGGPTPTEDELAAYEAESAGIAPAPARPAPKPAAVKAAPARAASTRAARPVEELEPLDDDRRRSPVRRRKRGVPLWVVLLCLSGMLGGAAVAGVLIWKATTENDEPAASARTAKKSDKDKGADKADDRKGDGKTDDRKNDGKADDRKDDGKTDIKRDDRPAPAVDDPSRPKPPPKMPRLTLEKFRMLSLGTTEIQAKAILGSPTEPVVSSSQIDPVTKKAVSIRVLTWKDGTDAIQLTFVSKKLAAGGAVLGGLTVPLGG